MVATLTSRRIPASTKEARCGPLCRTVRAVPVGNSRALTLELCDVSYHEGQAFERGRASGQDAARLSGAAAMLMLFRPEPPRPPTATLTAGPLTIELAARTVLVAGREIRLTAVEFDLLACLAEKLGQVRTYREIGHRIWPLGIVRQNHGSVMLADPQQTLRVHAGRLRSKLGPARSLLETRPWVGLLLRAEPPIGAPS